MRWPRWAATGPLALQAPAPRLAPLCLLLAPPLEVAAALPEAAPVRAVRPARATPTRQRATACRPWVAPGPGAAAPPVALLEAEQEPAGPVLAPTRPAPPSSPPRRCAARWVHQRGSWVANGRTTPALLEGLPPLLEGLLVPLLEGLLVPLEAPPVAITRVSWIHAARLEEHGAGRASPSLPAMERPSAARGLFSTQPRTSACCFKRLLYCVCGGPDLSVEESTEQLLLRGSATKGSGSRKE